MLKLYQLRKPTWWLDKLDCSQLLIFNIKLVILKRLKRLLADSLYFTQLRTYRAEQQEIIKQ